LTEDVKARRNTGTMNDFENISTSNREWIEGTQDEPSKG
jgi:hypothetical protein